MSTSVSCAPSLASRTAVARPSPDPPPVITIVLPLNRAMMTSFHLMSVCFTSNSTIVDLTCVRTVPGALRRYDGAVDVVARRAADAADAAAWRR